MFFQLGFVEHVRQAAETAPVVGRRAAAVRNQELERGEILEQVAFQQLHEGGGVGVEVMRPGGVKGRIATGADVDHGRNVVFHHLLVDGVPEFVGQRRRCPVAAARVRVQVDADVAVLLHAFHQFGDAGGRVHAGRLRQHGHRVKPTREELAHAVDQFIADSGPGAADLEITDVVGHETGTRREQGDVAAAFQHQLELVGANSLAEIVVADFQIHRFGHFGRVCDARHLRIAPILQRLGGGGVVAVAVDDQCFLRAHCVSLGWSIAY